MSVGTIKPKRLATRFAVTVVLFCQQPLAVQGKSEFAILRTYGTPEPWFKKTCFGSRRPGARVRWCRSNKC